MLHLGVRARVVPDEFPGRAGLRPKTGGWRAVGNQHIRNRH